MTKKHRPEVLSRPISDQDIFDLINDTNQQYLEWLTRFWPSPDTPAVSSDPGIDRGSHSLDLIFYTSSHRPTNALLE